MFSKQEAEGIARKAVAALIGALLAFALLSSLLIAGLVLLLWAATAALTPLVGQAGALGISGAICFVLLGLFFWRLISARAMPKEEGGAKSPTMSERLENTIRENPLEAALGAFALGVFGQADPRFRAMVLRSGMAYMKQAQADSGEVGPEEAANDEAASGNPAGGEP
ncbi:hypothetical protein [Marinobacter zhanjiangensis]|uniref:Holin-X, holin superfamily III n=1 Tax=Marinobacter zhanjiangensis TaxID=578215 RepID=A0ABQ3BA58_9GAMM|nr:hypothetical protein [Marinobacter zhanjiangensis]GGY80566.1 hypothetical protein GCM10007071_29890 [Marinobacter zhanjiangensis]